MWKPPSIVPADGEPSAVGGGREVVVCHSARNSVDNSRVSNERSVCTNCSFVKAKTHILSYASGLPSSRDAFRQPSKDQRFNINSAQSLSKVVSAFSIFSAIARRYDGSSSPRPRSMTHASFLASRRRCFLKRSGLAVPRGSRFSGAPDKSLRAAKLSVNRKLPSWLPDIIKTEHLFLRAKASVSICLSMSADLFRASCTCGSTLLFRSMGHVFVLEREGTGVLGCGSPLLRSLPIKPFRRKGLRKDVQGERRPPLSLGERPEELFSSCRNTSRDAILSNSVSRPRKLLPLRIKLVLC